MSIKGEYFRKAAGTELINTLLSLQGYESLRQFYGGSLATAVSSIGSSNKTLIIDTDNTVTANLTVPRNIELEFRNGAQITVASGITLTLKRAPKDTYSQVFAGSGTVDLSGSGASFVRPEWWGADNASSDNQPAFQAAVDSLGSQGGLVQIGQGNWTVLDETTVAQDRIFIQGLGPDATRILSGIATVNTVASQPSVFKWQKASSASLAFGGLSDVDIRHTAGSNVNPIGVRLVNTTKWRGKSVDLRIQGDNGNEWVDVEAAYDETGNGAPYAFTDGDEFTVDVEGGGAQTVTLETADFSDITAATAAEVVAVINTDVTGATAYVVRGDGVGAEKVRIQSDNTTTASSINVQDGSGNPNVQLGFTTGAISGTAAKDFSIGLQTQGHETGIIEGWRFFDCDQAIHVGRRIDGSGGSLDLDGWIFRDLICQGRSGNDTTKPAIYIDDQTQILNTSFEGKLAITGYTAACHWDNQRASNASSDIKFHNVRCEQPDADDYIFDLRFYVTQCSRLRFERCQGQYDNPRSNLGIYLRGVNDATLDHYFFNGNATEEALNVDDSCKKIRGIGCQFRANTVATLTNMEVVWSPKEEGRAANMPLPSDFWIEVVEGSDDTSSPITNGEFVAYWSAECGANKNTIIYPTAVSASIIAMHIDTYHAGTGTIGHGSFIGLASANPVDGFNLSTGGGNFHDVVVGDVANGSQDVGVKKDPGGTRWVIDNGFGQALQVVARIHYRKA